MVKVDFEDYTSKGLFVKKLHDLKKSYLELSCNMPSDVIDGDRISMARDVIFINDEDVQLAEYSCLVLSYSTTINGIG